jgi:hypothetical protein
VHVCRVVHDYSGRGAHAVVERNAALALVADRRAGMQYAWAGLGLPVELRADELDQADWPRYLAQEQAIFDSVRTKVTQALVPRLQRAASSAA